MKKGIRMLFICAAIYMLSFGLAAAVMGTGSAERDSSAAGPDIVVNEAISGNGYVIREYNGAVAVFMGTDLLPIIETDICVSGLRQNDRCLVEQGITVSTYTEVLCLLEDFNS